MCCIQPAVYVVSSNGQLLLSIMWGDLSTSNNSQVKVIKDAMKRSGGGGGGANVCVCCG